MRTERESAIRLLQWMMIASLVLPAALFGYAAWNDYRDVQVTADERIARSLDVMQEQALRVFQTVDRTFAEVGEVVRGMPDAQIRDAQASLHQRLQRIVEVMPQIQAIVLIGRDGRPLASSALDTVPEDASFAHRDYFTAQAERDIGTYVSDMRTPRLRQVGSDFFIISRRRPAADGSFNGVIAVEVRPRYFADFYQMIEQTPGGFYALVRSDGTFLARSPPRASAAQALGANSALRRAIDQGLQRGEFSVNSEIDGVPRRIGFRKLNRYPVYAVTGTASAAIRAAWLEAMAAHLMFGLPATLLLFAVLWVALRRTKRLYDEAQRRETAEGALHQAQQLQAIGQLTGGVAHDFNNLLMIVRGSAERLRRHITEPKQRQLLDAIAKATERGESLTRQLLTFSRRQMLQPSVIDLAERLPEIKDMLSRSLRGDIEIRLGIPRRPCLIKVDPNEFELALLNLAVNARDAMPSGGALTIAAKPVVMRGKASEEGLRGDFVAVRVADSGAGIPPDVLPRVFEPFFTTKEVGKGTGLGLSQVYGFARQSGGTASITTSPRRGTVVTLLLPRSFEARAQPREQIAAVARPAAAGTGLLVEDNAEVADVVKAYLEQLGFTVTLASGAPPALDLIAGDSTIDLVCSDILMPGGMNGLELADTIRQKYPGIALLLMTGYSSSAEDAVHRGFAVLQKPFDFAALERALRRAQSMSKQPVPEAEQAVG
jgi:two-component system NtrC family sensor kinase